MNVKPIVVAVISSSRADYGHLYWPLKRMQQHPALEPQLILFGAHLSPEFGLTCQDAVDDGFEIYDQIECLLSSDTDVGMAKTIGLASLGLTDTLARLRPDVLLVIADRYEMLAAASVALALRIPMAHIEGGEISRGAIDDAVRNALSKMSHLHFTPHEQATKRVIAMGELPQQVHTVGAPSLDQLKHACLIEETALRRKLDIHQQTVAVVAYHPVTIKHNTLEECDAVFAALEKLPAQLVFCFPNADAGSREIIERSQQFCQNHPDARLFINLPSPVFWSLLKIADLMIGNSSSGIMETPSLKLPSVNIGLRQDGRLQAANIIQANADTEQILRSVKLALSAEFSESLADLSNPYGDGDAGQRIADILATSIFDEKLRIKA